MGLVRVERGLTVGRGLRVVELGDVHVLGGWSGPFTDWKSSRSSLHSRQ